MTTPVNPSAQQIWQQQAGEHWVRRQEQTDRQLAPVGRLALDALAPRAGEWALDVGCGAGATVLELAERVGPTGGVCGVDISAPMLARARERAEQAGLANAEFVLADAQKHTFPRRYDLVFSRFGVMFFEDARTAFRNLHAALVDGGRMGFVCWQGLQKNPWATLLLEAVLPLVPGGKPPAMFVPELPGPFYFGDERFVRDILSNAGFSSIAITPVEREMHFGAAMTLAEAVDYAFDIGPASRVAAEADPALRPAFRAALEQALAPHTSERGTWVQGAVFVVTARK